MILKEFNQGWQDKFERRLSFLQELFPEVTLISAERYSGMLRTKFSSDNPEIQYILDAVSYKVERESALVCEVCGNSGIRKDDYLPEKMCLCWKCHALQIEHYINLNKE